MVRLCGAVAVQGFQGVDYSTKDRSSGPVQFENDPAEADPFGLDQMLSKVCSHACISAVLHKTYFMDCDAPVDTETAKELRHVWSGKLHLNHPPCNATCALRRTLECILLVAFATCYLLAACSAHIFSDSAEPHCWIHCRCMKVTCDAAFFSHSTFAAVSASVFG